MHAVEREPVETRVLNPTASEASYKSKQRSYRKTTLEEKVLAPDSPGAPKRTRPLKGNQMIKYFVFLLEN